VQASVKTLIEDAMEELLIAGRVRGDEPLDSDFLFASLFPDELNKATYLQQKAIGALNDLWKTLILMAAEEGLGYSVANFQVHGVVRTERLRRIARVLDSLEHPQKGKQRVRPDWRSELAYVLEGRGKEIPVTVVCDVYAEDRKKHKKYAFELKAPLPNSDQTKVSKEKLLKLYSMEPRQIDAAYYALPYNPYGRRENYSWSFPARWFNMREDEVILIGDEFWEKIGGLGTYRAFIDAVNEIGPKYKNGIYREFLGIEPPQRADAGRL
jgi:hypothetical protein